MSNIPPLLVLRRTLNTVKCKSLLREWTSNHLNYSYYSPRYKLFLDEMMTKEGCYYSLDDVDKLKIIKIRLLAIKILKHWRSKIEL